jgi:hypothetical protein
MKPILMNIQANYKEKVALEKNLERSANFDQHKMREEKSAPL